MQGDPPLVQLRLQSGGSRLDRLGRIGIAPRAVGRAHDFRDAVSHEPAAQIERLGQIGRPVVDPRQDMAMAVVCQTIRHFCHYFFQTWTISPMYI